MAASRRKVKRPGLDLKAKLAALIDVYELSQSALSRKTGIHQTRISKWLDGKGKPDEERMVQIAEAIQVPFAYLADPRRTEYPSPLRFKAEMQLLDMIARLGHEEAMDRLLLRSTAQVTTVEPPAGAYTGKQAAGRPRLHRRPGA